MKVRQAEQKMDDYGEGEGFVIEVDGKVRISAGHGEAEDNYLRRDLHFVYDIIPLMQEAHEAGKRGEPLEVVKEVVEDLWGE